MSTIRLLEDPFSLPCCYHACGEVGHLKNACHVASHRKGVVDLGKNIVHVVVDIGEKMEAKMIGEVGFSSQMSSQPT